MCVGVSRGIQGVEFEEKRRGFFGFSQMLTSGWGVLGLVVFGMVYWMAKDETNRRWKTDISFEIEMRWI